MFQYTIKYKSVIFLIVSLALTACGGGVGEVENSHPSQFAPKSAPDILINRNDKNQLVIDWSVQQDAQNYQLYISSSADFPGDATLKYEISQPPYIIESLDPGKTYYAKLRPAWESKTGPESAAKEFAAPPLPPSAIASEKVDNKETLTWQSDAENFSVYWSKSAEFKLAEAEGFTQITDKQFQPSFEDYSNGDVVYYTVTTLNGSNESEISAFIPITVSKDDVTVLPTPVNLKVVRNVENTAANASWDEVVGVENYILYRHTSAEFDDTAVTPVDSVVPAYEDNDVVPGETYYYWVAAKQGDSLSDRSNAVKVTMFDGILPPTKPKVTASDGAFSMEWNPVSTAASYAVYMAEDSAVNKSNTATLTSGMTHLGVQSPFGHSIANGSMFYLVATATGSDDTESFESAMISVRPKAKIAGVPDSVSIQAEEDQVTISWGAVEGAQSYNVYWSTSADVTAQTGELVPGGADITATSITHSALQNGVMHYYVVTALHNTGESEESALVGATPYGILDKPSGILAKEGDKQITLEWPDHPGAVKYHLYMAADASVTKDNALSLSNGMVHTENITSPFTHPGLVNNLTYYLRIAAVGPYGRESEASDAVPAAPHGIDNRPPVIVNEIPDQSVDEDSLYSYQIAENTFEDPDDEQLNYSVKLSDGSELPDWISFNADIQTLNGTPLNDDVGSLDISVTASDAAKASVTDTFTLEIINTNDTPIASDITSRIIKVGDPLNMQLLESTFTDPDDDSLTLTATVAKGDLPRWLTFDNSTWSFSGTPNVADIGELNIDVTADDGNGGSVTSSFQLVVRNNIDNPIANDDGVISVAEGGQVSIDVLSNDIPANSPLESSSITIIDNPANGSVSLTVDGVVVYSHDGGETTADSFTYTVKDQDGKLSEKATVSLGITPQNDAPQISGSPETTIDIGATYSFTPTVTDPDAGDTLVFNIENKPVWAVFDKNSGELRGTVNSLDAVQNIIISVSDGQAEDALLAFNITVNGKAPVATDDTAEIIAAGNSVRINLLENDSDSDGTLDPASVSIINPPSNGQVTVNPDGSVDYQNKPGSTPNDSFTYMVKDNDGIESNIATVDISATPWFSEDIGDVGEAGNTSRGPGTVTISASGADIWSVADAFHFNYKQITGDFDISVRVADIQNPQRWIKAGLMVRESLTPGSKNVKLFVTDVSLIRESVRGVHLQARHVDNEVTTDLPNRFNGEGAPRYIRLIRRSNTFEAYESVNGNTWLLTGSVNLEMNKTVYTGISLTSHNKGVLSTVSFDNFSLINQPINPPVAVSTSTLPLENQSTSNGKAFYRIEGLEIGKTYTVGVQAANNEDFNLQVYRDPFNFLECESFLANVGYEGCLATANTSNELYVKIDGSYTTDDAKFSLDIAQWTSLDIGTNTQGYDSENDVDLPLKDEYLVAGSGKDIFAASDGFRYFYQPVSGDVEIIAKLTRQDPTNPWAKAGVMIRESTQANARFVDVVKTASNSVRFQSRSEVGADVAHNGVRVNDVTATRWLRLVRRDTAFDAYEANSGWKWLFLGTVNVPNMSKNALAGLAVTAHDGLDEQISEATFENIKVYNGSGPALNIESVAGPIAVAKSFSVDRTDKFIKVTGLNNNSLYTVEILNLSNDADLYVYSDEFKTLQCPVIEPTNFNPSNETGTTKETCNNMTSTNQGELFIRVNGSYTQSGASFDLTVQ